MVTERFIDISFELDRAGLVWHPEIGDEVVSRSPEEQKISLLFDPQGLTPTELRDLFVWLPSLEQLIEQIEARQALIEHAGIGELFEYEAVVKTACGIIEASAKTLRSALGIALFDILEQNSNLSVH